MVPQLIDGKTEFPFRTRAGGQWPPLEGRVRPATNREIRAHDARVAEARARLGRPAANTCAAPTAEQVEDEVVRLQAAFYAPRLASWNVDAPITPETVAVLPNEIFGQLDNVVAGTGGLLLGNSDATSPS